MTLHEKNERAIFTYSLNFTGPSWVVVKLWMKIAKTSYMYLPKRHQQKQTGSRQDKIDLSEHPTT